MLPLRPCRYPPPPLRDQSEITGEGWRGEGERGTIYVGRVIIFSNKNFGKITIFFLPCTARVQRLES